MSADERPFSERREEHEWVMMFESKPLNPVDLEELKEVRAAYQALGSVLYSKLPAGRYKAMVKTKLEEAAMLSTKAFTHT